MSAADSVIVLSASEVGELCRVKFPIHFCLLECLCSPQFVFNDTDGQPKSRQSERTLETKPYKQFFECKHSMYSAWRDAAL